MSGTLRQRADDFFADLAVEQSNPLTELLESIYEDAYRAGRQSIKESDIRDAIRLAIAEDDPGDYDFEVEDSGEPGLSNRDVDRLAYIAAAAVVSRLETEETQPPPPDSPK